MNYGSIGSMKKAEAIDLLGGTVSSVAKHVGVSYQAVEKWPEELPRRISDRVIAAVARTRPGEWPDLWREIAQGVDAESATVSKEAGHV